MVLQLTYYLYEGPGYNVVVTGSDNSNSTAVISPLLTRALILHPIGRLFKRPWFLLTRGTNFTCSWRSLYLRVVLHDYTQVPNNDCLACIHIPGGIGNSDCVRHRYCVFRDRSKNNENLRTRGYNFDSSTRFANPWFANPLRTNLVVLLLQVSG